METQDFDVIFPEELSEAKEVPIDGEQKYSAELAVAAAKYDPSNREYTAYLGGTESQVSLTQSRIEELSVSPQSDLSKTQNIIQINRQYVNKNDLFGATQDAIENNVNTEVRLTWADKRTQEDKVPDIEQIKAIITDFNAKIGLDKLIRNAVATTFRDGTYVLYLRRRAGKSNSDFSLTDYVVDSYPLGVAEISDYEVGGDPYVLLNVDELKTRLNKTHKKTKKNQPLFFKATADEIKANYPSEVEKAFTQKEKYAKLDISNSGVMRINNQGKQYGLSPFFRALPPALMLEKFEAADRSIARNRAKTIIGQYMNKEIMGPEYTKDGYVQQAWAHENLMNAWRQTVVAVTPPPSVREIRYIEPTANLTNIQMIKYYRERIMSTLGVQFLIDGSGQSLGSINSGSKQLIRTINKISKQLEPILEKWYKVVLQDSGIDPKYAPTIEILDSEMLEMNAKMELARTLHQTFNCSYETAFEVLGRSFQDEKMRREAENEANVSEIFKPWANAYTNSTNNGNSGGGESAPEVKDAPKAGEKKGGRTPDEDSKNPEKQAYDQLRYENLKNT